METALYFCPRQRLAGVFILPCKDLKKMEWVSRMARLSSRTKVLASVSRTAWQWENARTTINRAFHIIFRTAFRLFSRNTKKMEGSSVTRCKKFLNIPFFFILFLNCFNRFCYSIHFVLFVFEYCLYFNAFKLLKIYGIFF